VFSATLREILRAQLCCDRNFRAGDDDPDESAAASFRRCADLGSACIPQPDLNHGDAKGTERIFDETDPVEATFTWG
jgi:hypothetical protein